MEVTKRLMEAGRIMNIPVIDHIIVAGGTAQHYSFMQNHPQMFKVHEKQEYSVNEPLNETINNFRSVTDRLFNPDSMEGMKPSDIEEVVQAHVSQMIEEYGIDARRQEVIVSGSRCRGMEHEGSDIDVVVSFTGNEKEDDLFNLLHEEKLYLGSVELDINPINTEQSGPLSEYLNGVEKHLEEKRASIEQNKKQVEEYKPLAKVEELLEENYNQIDNVISNVPPDTKEKNKQKTVNFEEYKKVHTRVSMKRKLAEKKAEIARRDCKDHGTEKDVKPHGIGVED
jgi:predicted nucleotidyltransferase